MPVSFSYLPTRGKTDLAPLLPIQLWIRGGTPIETVGLLDSGSTINVMPYELGVSLGASWDSQTSSLSLAGNLAHSQAKALIVQARIGDFEPARLVFAWSRASDVPLLLGQTNFFQIFDVCFHRTRLEFDLQLASRKD